MKKVEKRAIIQKEYQFDDYAYAKKIVDATEAKQKRIKIGLIISAVSAGLLLLGEVLPFDLPLSLEVFVAMSLISFVISGCLGPIIKLLINLMVISFFIVPIIPFDFIIAGAVGMIAGGLFILFPIVPVGICLINNLLELKAAREYMECYREVE